MQYVLLNLLNSNRVNSKSPLIYDGFYFIDFENAYKFYSNGYYISIIDKPENIQSEETKDGVIFFSNDKNIKFKYNLNFCLLRHVKVILQKKINVYSHIFEFSISSNTENVFHYVLNNVDIDLNKRMLQIIIYRCNLNMLKALYLKYEKKIFNLIDYEMLGNTYDDEFYKYFISLLNFEYFNIIFKNVFNEPLKNKNHKYLTFFLINSNNSDIVDFIHEKYFTKNNEKDIHFLIKNTSNFKFTQKHINHICVSFDKDTLVYFENKFNVECNVKGFDNAFYSFNLNMTDFLMSDRGFVLPIYDETLFENIISNENAINILNWFLNNKYPIYFNNVIINTLENLKETPKSFIFEWYEMNMDIIIYV